MKVVSLINKFNGCDYHRIKLPVAYMNGAGYIQGVGDYTTMEEKLADCNILYYNRSPIGTTLDHVLSLRDKFGFKIVVDIDDYWELYPGHYMEVVWAQGNMKKEVCRNLTIADAVTCTTDRLAEKVRKYNSKVFVCPNGLPFGDGQFTDDRTTSDRLRFIYAGGGSHLWDIRLLRNTALKLSREIFNSQLTLAGVADGVPIYDQMIRYMGAGGKLKNFNAIQYKMLDCYMDLYNEGDIALAPLVRNQFNNHKSNLKVIEAGCKRMPIIVSNNGPYGDDTCPLLMRVDTPTDWYRWIRYCENNPSFVQENGDALHAYVKHNYDLRLMNYLRLEAFKSVL